MKDLLILLGVLLVVGLGVWLYSSSQSGGPQPETLEPVSNEPKPPLGSPQQPLQPSEGPANFSELLCAGTSDAPKPKPRRPTLIVMAACVEAQGLVMFVTRLPDTEDYLFKIGLVPRYALLREACRAVAPQELKDLDSYLSITIAKEDWPKFSAILQPEGPFTPYKIGVPVRVQGVYVFSTETNRHIYGPHCEIHPLQKLELQEEKKDEGQ